MSRRARSRNSQQFTNDPAPLTLKYRIRAAQLEMVVTWVAAHLRFHQYAFSTKIEPVATSRHEEIAQYDLTIQLYNLNVFETLKATWNLHSLIRKAKAYSITGV